MMKLFFKMTAVLLCLIFALCPLSVSASEKIIADFKTGAIIEFGSYPQSLVTDEVIISELNKIAGDNTDWISYNYFSGSGTRNDGQMKSGDYMRYTDVMYGTEKYRGVIIDSFRPNYTGNKTLPEKQRGKILYQSDNGYCTDTAYWFRYEPVKWRVLDPVDGLIMCAFAIDSQPFNNYEYKDTESRKVFGEESRTYFASCYEKSSIRAWLNDDFYNSAFTQKEQLLIQKSTIDNISVYSSEYDSESTADNVFLLSYDEVQVEKYGFTPGVYVSVPNLPDPAFDPDRQIKSTDYAKCQGCYQHINGEYAGYCEWWLRTPSDSGGACWVSFDGKPFVGSDTNGTYRGIVPVLRLSDKNEDIADDNINIENGTEESKDNSNAATDSGTTPSTVIVPESDPQVSRKVSITEYSPSIDVEYKSTVVFHAQAPEGYTVVWSNGQRGNECEISDVTDKIYSVNCFLEKDGVKISGTDSETVTVNVGNGFFARLVAFFRTLFKTLPIYSDFKKL